MNKNILAKENAMFKRKKKSKMSTTRARSRVEEASWPAVPMTTNEGRVILPWGEKTIEKAIQPKQFKEIQDKLDEKKPLFLGVKITKEYSSLYVFLNDFFKHYNQLFNTVYKDGTIACTPGRRRSVGDVYRITKTYMNGFTYEEVYDWMYKSGILTAFYCPDINKMVFRREVDSAYKDLQVDEYGMFPSGELLVSMQDNYVKFRLPEEMLLKISK